MLGQMSKTMTDSLLRSPLAPGTHIEEGAIIAMRAIVAGRIPRGAIVGVAKWRILKTRDLDHYEKLKAEGKFH